MVVADLKTQEVVFPNAVIAAELEVKLWGRPRATTKAKEAGSELRVFAYVVVLLCKDGDGTCTWAWSYTCVAVSFVY